MVSGLPLFSFRFGVLPPRVKLETEEERDKLDRLIATIFPDLTTELWSIVKYGFAVLALREEWLREKMPVDHCLFQCAVFWNRDYDGIKTKAKIELGVGDSNVDIAQVRDDELHCTGIPSHTVLLASQRTVVMQQKELVEKHNDLPGVIQTTIQGTGVNPNAEFRAAVNELRTIGGSMIDQMRNMTIVAQPTREQRVQQINLHYHRG